MTTVSTSTMASETPSPALPPPSSRSDATFWTRMNSASSKLDLPLMSATPTPPRLPLLELLVATPAGKPLLYFAYGLTPDNTLINTAESPSTHRPPSAQSALSAAAVAFQHTTASRVNLIRTSSGVSIALIVDALHIHAVSADPRTPCDLLRVLARLAVASIHATLSRAFADYLRARPQADVQHLLRPARRLLHAALLDAVTHPLPYLLQTPVALPCPTRPSARAAVAEVLRRALVRWRDALTHALVFTASPPFPRRVVASAAPANRELSPVDVMLLMNVAPLRADAELELPERIYLQADGFGIASQVVLRKVELRLDPDHYEDFRNAVGGAQWRPEWNAAGGDALWIMGVVRKGEGAGVGEEFLDYVEKSFDRARATKDLMVSMERPLTIDDMSLEIEPELKVMVRALILIEQRRMIGTLGSFGHAAGVSIIESLKRWERDGEDVSSPLMWRRKHALLVRFPHRKVFVVVWKQKFVICFDSRACEEEALAATEKSFVPWMTRFQSSLVPEQDRALIPPQTPLAGFFSPFQS